MVTNLKSLETYYDRLKIWRSHIDPKVIREEMIQVNKDIHYYRKVNKRNLKKSRF